MSPLPSLSLMSQRTDSTLYRGAAAENLARPLALQHPKNFQGKRHDFLPFRRYGLWRITEGYVRTYTYTPEDELVPLGFWSAGDLFGYPTVQTYPYQVECLTSVSAEYLDRSYSVPKEAVLAQAVQTGDLLRISHCRQSELRLLQFVCWLAIRFGLASSKGRYIQIRLTHQEIADAIGMTRVTVTRLLKKLERENKLHWSPKEKVVYNVTLKQASISTHL